MRNECADRPIYRWLCVRSGQPVIWTEHEKDLRNFHNQGDCHFSFFYVSESPFAAMQACNRVAHKLSGVFFFLRLVGACEHLDR